MMTRKGTFDLLTFLVIFSFSSNASSLPLDWSLEPGVTALFNGRTMARIEVDDTNLTRCDLRIVELEKRESEILALKTENVSVAVVNFTTMLEIIHYCEELALAVKNVDTRIEKETPSFWGGLFNSFKTFSQGIAPGTLWCGFDDIALTYESLGTNTPLDSCCRVHDFCPDKLKPKMSRDGLFNEDIVTKSNCKCEETFRDCLKDVDSFSASAVGRLYFNTNQECIDMRHPRRCLKWEAIKVENGTKSYEDEDFFSSVSDQSTDNNSSRLIIDEHHQEICAEYMELEGEPLQLQFVENVRFV